MTTTTETTEADRTTYRVLPIAELHVHPRNPRRKATPDDELVTSIKEHGLVQPLVVAPIPGDERTERFGDAAANPAYTVIGGHRRLAAAKKARLKTLPCVVRRDLATEAQQVEAMLLENSSRTDLSPIEEAEGYQQLLDLGYKQKDIARVTGRTPKTVSTRLRMLKLAKSTQTKVHAGQVSLEDAAALIEFADDPKLTKELEKKAGGYDFRHALETARRRRKAGAAVDVAVAAYEQDGIPVAFTADTYSDFSTKSYNYGGKVVERAGEQVEVCTPVIAEHPGCLAYAVVPASEYSSPGIYLYCSEPAKHATPAEAEDDAARERELEEARVEEEAREVARQVRIGLVVEETEREISVLDDALLRLAIATLPTLLHDTARQMRRDVMRTYRERLDVPGTVEWSTYGAGAPALVDHLHDLAEWSPKRVTTAFVTILTALADDQLRRYHHGDDQVELALAGPYADLLEALGHEWQPAEAPLLTVIRPAAEPDPEGGAS